MPRLAGVARGPQHRPPPDHQPGTDAHLAGDEDEVVEPASRAATVLPQRAEVRLVGHVDPPGRQVEARREQRAEGHALPPQVGGEVDEAVRATGQPGHRRADPREALGREVAGEPGGDLDHAAYDVLGRRPPAREPGALLVEDVAPEADRRHRHGLHAELHGQCDRGVRAHVHHR